LLSFFSLFVEHFFSKPTDVLATTISILLLLVPLKREFSLNLGWYYAYLGYTGLIGVISFISILLFESDKQTGLKYQISNILKTIAVTLGKTKYQYFVLFLIATLCFVDSNSKYFLILFCFALIIITDPWKLIEQIYSSIKPKKTKGIGEIFGVQSKNTFLVKLYSNVQSVDIFDLVVFRYSLEKYNIKKGIIVDIYLLNQEQWLKVLVDKSFNKCTLSEKEKKNLEDNVVYQYTAVRLISKSLKT